jgi:hypothetical protein
LHADFDKAYGLDVLLNNGKKYFPFGNPVIGHPFWRSDNSFSGDITVSGKTFKNQQLKYNLHRQEFMLTYTNFNGQQGQIILNNLVIDSVRVEKYLFIPNKLPVIREQFVQLIYQGKLSCYIGLSKELKFNSTGVNTGYKYTDANRTNYIVLNGIVHRFKKRSTFLGIFYGKNKAEIRKYLSSHRLRFRNIDENDLRKLVTYCEETIN